MCITIKLYQMRHFEHLNKEQQLPWLLYNENIYWSVDTVRKKHEKHIIEFTCACILQNFKFRKHLFHQKYITSVFKWLMNENSLDWLVFYQNDALRKLQVWWAIEWRQTTPEKCMLAWNKYSVITIYRTHISINVQSYLWINFNSVCNSQQKYKLQSFILFRLLWRRYCCSFD